jgi:hypothetical protein
MPSAAPAAPPQPAPVTGTAAVSSGSNVTPDLFGLWTSSNSNKFWAQVNEPAAKAAPPIQVNASVEIYELTKPQAFSIQDAFAGGSDTERKNILLKLRDGVFPKAARTIGLAQRACETGQTSDVSCIREYRYPTEFDTDKSGMAIPTAFETRNLGWGMSLNVSEPGKDGDYSVVIEVDTVALESTAHYSASKADVKGGITQPIFTNEQIMTRVRMMPGIPKLVGMYSPFKDDKTGDVLRLVFVTVQPDK